MPVILSCSGIQKAFGARVLFRDFSISIFDGDRTGIIGPNGSGKTVLLEILAGKEPPDAGERAVRKLARIAYVPQDSLFESADTVRSVLHAAVDPLPLDDLEKSNRVDTTVSRVGFENADAPAASLSGGWKKRLAIAAALITNPDVLLLDEPTNHLDLDGILWLERTVALANACLVVTHDRYFLENVATKVSEINRRYPEGVFPVKGNYSEFLEKREEFLEAQSKQQESLATKVRREVEWLRRGPNARTGKSRARIDSAEALIDQLAESTARGRVSTAQIDFTASGRKTKRLIEAEAISKTLGGRTLFRNLNVTLLPGVRIGLVGPNGSGKTTLLKIVEGALPPDEGEVRRADGLKIVAFAQNRAEHLDPDSTLRRALSPEGDSVLYRGRPVHVAGWAKRFLFRDEQLEMPVAKLSGGERARVIIARLMLQSADVLLLDEPTNDLDIPTLEVLEDCLLDFPGAVMLVSHDRYLLDRVSTTVIGLNGDQAGIFADYSQWEAWREQERAAARPVLRETRVQAPDAGPRRKLSYLEQREWDGMEAAILEAEEAVAAIQREMHEAATDPMRLHQAYDRLQPAQRRVEELYARWAELEAKVTPGP